MLGVGCLFNVLVDDNVDYVCLYYYDVVEVLEKEIVDGVLDEVCIYFFDLWYKKCYNKCWLI